MVSVLQDYLKEQNIEAQVDKSSLMACTTDTFNSYDLIVSSTKLDNLHHYSCDCRSGPVNGIGRR